MGVVVASMDLGEDVGVLLVLGMRARMVMRRRCFVDGEGVGVGAAVGFVDIGLLSIVRGLGGGLWAPIPWWRREKWESN